MLATSVPSLVRMVPRASPRAPKLDTGPTSKSSHSSARAGRLNHMAWSRLAPMKRAGRLLPGARALPTTPMSEMKARAQAWRAGSSGRVRAALTHMGCRTGNPSRWAATGRISKGTHVGEAPEGRGRAGLLRRRDVAPLGQLPVVAGLGDAEGGHEHQGGLSQLGGGDPPGGEGAAVAGPLHLQLQGGAGPAGPEEVGVEGVGP